MYETNLLSAFGRTSQRCFEYADYAEIKEYNDPPAEVLQVIAGVFLLLGEPVHKLNVSISTTSVN